jgi:hypothetical protein
MHNFEFTGIMNIFKCSNLDKKSFTPIIYLDSSLFQNVSFFLYLKRNTYIQRRLKRRKNECEIH